MQAVLVLLPSLLVLVAVTLFCRIALKRTEEIRVFGRRHLLAMIVALVFFAAVTVFLLTSLDTYLLVGR